MNKIVAIGITGCIFLLLTVRFTSSEKSFDDITGNAVPKIAYVTFVNYRMNEEQEETADKEILNDYAGKKYVKYTGDLGSTHQFIFRFYDDSHKLLFELCDVGNGGIVGITTGERTRYYRIQNK